jgi:hypothetical protein
MGFIGENLGRVKMFIYIFFLMGLFFYYGVSIGIKNG